MQKAESLIKVAGNIFLGNLYLRVDIKKIQRVNSIYNGHRLYQLLSVFYFPLAISQQRVGN